MAAPIAGPFSTRSEEQMMETDRTPREQTGAGAQEHEPEIGPGSQPGDDTDAGTSPGGRP
jgi:hypothetical protein